MLTDAQIDTILTRLAYHDSVAVPVPKLHLIAKFPASEVFAILERLEAQHLIERWPEKNAVVLSTTGGARIGFELTCDRRNRLRWHKSGSRWCKAAKAAFFRADADPISTLETAPPDRPKGKPGTFIFADFRNEEGRGCFDEGGNEGPVRRQGRCSGHPDVEATVEDFREGIPGTTSAEMAGIVMPRLLVGADLIWPLESRADGRCPACWEYEKMPHYGYCLWCDRSGSPNIPVIPPHVKAKIRALRKASATPTRPRPDDGLAGGVGGTRKRPAR
jgi:hypothetical protein